MNPSCATTSARVWAFLDALAAPSEPTEKLIALCKAAAQRAEKVPTRAVKEVALDLLAHMKVLVDELPRAGGPLEMSNAGAAYLDQLGESGKQAACKVREKVDQRMADGGEAAAWAGWVEDSDDGSRCRYVEALALVLVSRWKRKTEMAAKKAPAVFNWVHEDRMALRAPGTMLDEDVDEGQAMLRRGGVPVALFCFDTPNVLEHLRRAVRDHLGASLLLERVLRALARRVHDQAIDGVNPCTRLKFNGLGGFCSTVGIPSARDQAKVLDLLELLQAWRGNRRDVPPMISYWLWRASRGRPAQLRIDVGEALAPGYFDGGKIAPPWANRRQRFLIPVLELPNLDFVGNKLKANLAAFQWELLLAMRERVVDYPSGFVFSDVEIERARDVAMVKPVHAAKAMEVWAAGPRAWLARRGDGLALRDRAADRLYLRAEQQVRSGRVGGLRRAARKANTRKNGR